MIKEGDKYKHYKNGKTYTVFSLNKTVLIQDKNGKWVPCVVYYEYIHSYSFVIPLSEFKKKFKKVE